MRNLSTLDIPNEADLLAQEAPMPKGSEDAITSADFAEIAVNEAERK